MEAKGIPRVVNPLMPFAERSAKIMKTHSRENYSRSIFQWFLAINIVVFLVFCCTLLPLVIYVNNIFSTLQKESIQHQLETTASQLESFVNGLDNSAKLLSTDNRFRLLHYSAEDPSLISVNDLTQLKTTLQGLLPPLDLYSYYIFKLTQTVIL